VGTQGLSEFWSLQVPELMSRLGAKPEGLTSEEARTRLQKYGLNLLRPKKKTDLLTLLLSQFKSPIIIILLFAAVLAFFLGDKTDAIIIFVIISISSLLGFWQERGATNAVEKLLALVQIKAAVFRDGNQVEIPVEEVVPGDIVVLNAGDVIPGDCAILESKDLFVGEAALTGETYPVEKEVRVLSPDTPLGERINILFMGTHVVSGTARALVVSTGKETEFGKVSERLKLRPPETEFEHGVKHFGYLLLEITVVLVVAVFVINVFFARPVLQAFLFSLALAVGLTPQLLPAIISINLAQGAKVMAREKVIVKRLMSIENFGSMNILCSDKTGTLTEGIVNVNSATDIDGQESDKVLFFAYINAFYETGFVNPIDEAVRKHRQFDLAGYEKLDEVPYDFVRKRLSILVSNRGAHIMITKGALQNILDVCSMVEKSDGTTAAMAEVRTLIQHRFKVLSSQGFRTLGVAYRNIGSDSVINKEYETEMTFLGFVVLFDPPKDGVGNTIKELKQLGVSLKVITGDNRLVAASVSKQVGLAKPMVLTASDLRHMSDEALLGRVNEVDVFAEVEPNQKERIIMALKKTGNVVGYMGDGINDASAIHSADVGISIDSAVDVAKGAADIVLLEKDLRVLKAGVQQGRMTFANTLKYVFMASSANFGNMFSMAGASLFLSFLPLLPKQILLTNLLTDFPEMTISTDNVDPETVDKPRRWDVKFIRNFMLVFGAVSSIFDYATFGVLLFILHANTTQFRTGWFMESVISAATIVLVIRSRRPFFKSRPGKYLLATTVMIITATIVLPYTPLDSVFGFQPLPIWFLFVIIGIVLLYIGGAEVAKRFFYKRIMF
jgi:Mg2+-importing ATPase